MIVICGECGKKYRLDVSKIKGAAARFKCRVCTHMIMVTKPQSASPALAVQDSAAAETAAETAAESGGKQAPVQEPETALDRSAAERGRVKPVHKPGALSLRTKMVLLFLFVPLVLMIGASLLYLWQLEQMSTRISSTVEIVS